MSGIKITLYLLAGIWVLAVAVLTLGLTMASKRGREEAREDGLDERMGEE
jgi:hypothetical protein